jgi:DnaJ-class molecular chaperone
MKDPYEALGVARDATDAAIRSAYRKLAKTHHPDLNPGKPEAAERFKEIGTAYGLLSDKDKRARFDRGEIDASGAERAAERGFYRDYGDAGGRTKYRADAGMGAEDIESIFAQAFRRRGGQGFSSRGQDMNYALTVDFLDAANGALRRLTLPDGSVLDVTIPAGIKDGQSLRLKGKGGAGFGGGAAGDALIEITVAPHKFFRRDGNDVILELPVTLKEAVLGAKIAVPTLKGRVTVTVPPHSTSGTRLRLKDRGIGGGHLYVDLKLVLPAEPEPALSDFLKDWQPRHEVNPRAAMEEES